jgi:hypothetical protein
MSLRSAIVRSLRSLTLTLALAARRHGTMKRMVMMEVEKGSKGRRGVSVWVEEAEIVPWEEWGPRAARVISPPTFHWITAHAGQRRLS